MALILSEQELNDIQLTADEVRLNVAIWLFAEQRISLGKAARLAGVSRFEFQNILFERNIPVIRYDGKEVAQELSSFPQV